MHPRSALLYLAAGIFLTQPTIAQRSKSFKPELDRTQVSLPRELGSTTIRQSSAMNYAIFEDFEGSFPPSGWTVKNPDGARTWQRTTLASGYDIGNASARLNFYDYSPNSGQIDSLKSPVVSGLTSSDSLVFDYAYCEFPTGVVGPDTVEVYLSTDGGLTFATHIVTLSELDSTTGPTTDNWAPLANEWGTLRFGLPASVTGSMVQIVFVSHNHFGQNFYIDNVLLGAQPIDDIRAVSFDEPADGDDVVELVSFSPTATFENVGTGNQAFPFSVRYEIIASSSLVFYTSTKSITSLTSGATQQVVFDPVASGLPAGEYTIRATNLLALDVNNGNDTITGELTSLLRVTSFPYLQDFEESTEEGWTSATVSGSKNDWERGTPGKPTQLTGAHSGTKAWATKLDTTYSDNHNAALISPIFDFTSITKNFVVEFYHNFLMETGWDGTVMEYSTNLGSSWTRMENVLGTGPDFNTTRNRRWYNSNSTDGNLTPNKYSGSTTAYAAQTNGWIRSTASVQALVGKPNVRFRWRFRTDGSNVDEGWAIDDVSVFADSMKTVSIQLNAGWNAASNPLGSDFDSLFLSLSTNNIFPYNCLTGYSPSDSIPQGPGNWLKITSANTITIDGRLVEQDTIAVCSGWNFIGSISLTAPTSLITTEPAGIIISPFYSYTGSYTTTTALQPGKAYWVKTSAPGSLILTGTW